MIRKQLWIAFCLSLVLILTGCSPLSQTSTWARLGDGSDNPRPTTAIIWSDCTEKAKKLIGQVADNVSYQCGTIRVPQNWEHPDNNATFSIALMRVRSNSQEKRIGSLLVNPGGPGASGQQLAAATPLFLPLEVQKRFDIIGFDPRGVGESSPVQCITDAEKDRDVATEPDPNPEQLAQQFSDAQAISEQCAKKYGPALQYYSTKQTAQDMNAIRQAVGDEKLTYLGYSYGTLLGATYAQLFPNKIRALVLDGAVDPTLDSIMASESQVVGFEKAFDNFAADCVNRNCALGPDPRAALNQLFEQARTQPAKGTDGREATPGYMLYAVIAALYSKERWAALEQALISVGKGNPSGVFALADSYNDRDEKGHYSNSRDANTAINCADETQRVPEDQIAQLQNEWKTKYPLFGSALAISLMSCATWQAGQDPYPTGKAEGAPPVLLIGTTGDPATPYENTQKLADMLGTGTVLTWEGEGHTAYPQNRCVNEAVHSYLIELQIPEPGKRCTTRR